MLPRVPGPYTTVFETLMAEEEEASPHQEPQTRRNGHKTRLTEDTSCSPIVFAWES